VTEFERDDLKIQLDLLRAHHEVVAATMIANGEERDAAREQAKQLREAADLYREAWKMLVQDVLTTPRLNRDQFRLVEADSLIAKADAMMRRGEG
jgi:hypothetical protein